MRHEASLHIAARTARPAASHPTWGWRAGLAALWLAACAWLVAGRLEAIRTLRLPDGDDAMRLLQVRAWLAGQGWFDLRQYRLDPPAGADMHWSRLVDLPLAAVIAPLRPLIGAAASDAVAVAIVPLVTLGVALLLLALIARRLIAPAAWWWPPALLLLAGPPLGMMTPLRIDHHGWQIVLVLAMLLGLVTPDRRRGGIGAGLAIATSLAIGVEMLPCLALGAGLAAASWLADAREGERLRALCIAAGVGTVAALLAFVPSVARLGLACDALSLAYAAPLCAACVMLAIAAGGSPSGRARAGWIAVAGLAAGATMLMTGGGICLTDPYHAVDPAARTMWLDHVSEARPLWRQGAEVFLASLSLPLIGLAGAAMMIARAAPSGRHGWAIVLVLAGVALLLALASTRAAVVAMVLALPGAAALGHHGRAWLALRRGLAVRVFGSAALFLCVSAVAPRLLIAASLGEAPPPGEANAEACMAPAAVAALNMLPAGTVLGLIDSTPALLLHTHHRGLAGPYHRNGRAIADAMRAWSGTPQAAEAIIRRHRIAYVVACGQPAEATLYDSRAPNGFHARLMRGDAPGWLTPVRIPNTPWRAWAVSRPLPGEGAGA